MAKNRDCPVFTFPICPHEAALMDLWVKALFESIRKDEKRLEAYELLKLKNTKPFKRQIYNSISDRTVNDAIDQARIATSRFFKLSNINRKIFGVPDTPFVMVDTSGNIVDQPLPDHEITKLIQTPLCPISVIVADRKYKPV